MKARKLTCSLPELIKLPTRRNFLKELGLWWRRMAQVFLCECIPQAVVTTIIDWHVVSGLHWQNPSWWEGGIWLRGLNHFSDSGLTLLIWCSCLPVERHGVRFTILSILLLVSFCLNSFAVTNMAMKKGKTCMKTLLLTKLWHRKYCLFLLKRLFHLRLLLLLHLLGCQLFHLQEVC